jgi:WD40 repeat protein
MSSLAGLAEVVGFFSYSREDDEAFKGSLTGLRDTIGRELAAQLGRSKRNFRLWQDKEAIAPGRLWESEIRNAVEQAVFFIPIVTPRMVNSRYCQVEFDAFLAREQELGRSDLVFPILYISVAGLDDETRWRDDPVLSVIGKRQYVDWRAFRHLDVQSTTVREAVEQFCSKIVEALHRPWLSLQERKQHEEAQAQQQREEERKREEAQAARRAEETRQQAETEASARAEEDRRRREAEAKRRAEEEERRQRLEREAAAWVELQRSPTASGLRAFLGEFPDGPNATDAKTELARLQGEDEAFASCKRAQSAGAVAKFLSDHPTSRYAAEARALHATLLARDDAFKSALAAGTAAAFRGFLDAYPNGAAADELRGRLRELEPPPQWPRRKVLLAGAAGASAAAAIGLAAIYRHEPAKPEAQVLSPTPVVRPRNRLLHVLSGQSDDVDWVTFNADGSRIITSSFTRQENRLWDAKSGSGLMVMKGNAAKFSPDGSLVLLYSWGYGEPDPANYTASLVNARTGTLSATLSGHDGNLSSGSFSPDSSRVVTASEDKTARLWQAANGELIAVLRGHSDKVTDAQFSPNDDFILTNSADGTLRLWNAKTGTPVRTINVVFSSLSRAPAPARATAEFSPDGSMVAGWYNGKTARLWRTTTGESIAVLDHTGDGLNFKFSPDGERIATAVGNTSRLWDGRTGMSVATLVGHTDRVSTLHFNRGSNRLVTVGYITDFNPRLWDGKTGAAIATLSGHTDTVFGIFSTDGSRVYTTSWDKTTRVWEAATGLSMATLTNSEEYNESRDGTCMLTIVLSADPKLRAFDAKTGDAQLWNTKTMKAIGTLSGHTAAITNATFSPDGSIVATASKDKTTRIWDAAIQS